MLDLDQFESKFNIIAALTGKNIAEKARRAKRAGADMIELRIDGFNTKNSEDIIKIIKQIKEETSLMLIATIRSAVEQGMVPKGSSLTDEERLQLFLDVIPFIDMIDVEIESKSIQQQVTEKAYENNKVVILSYHNFACTPSKQSLFNYANKAADLGADIVKIAVTAKDKKDVRNLLLFCQDWQKTPIILLAMGTPGTITRVLGYVFGSCCTYGYIDESTAPGQLSVSELASARKLYFGE